MRVYMSRVETTPSDQSEHHDVYYCLQAQLHNSIEYVPYHHREKRP